MSRAHLKQLSQHLLQSPGIPSSCYDNLNSQLTQRFWPVCHTHTHTHMRACCASRFFVVFGSVLNICTALVILWTRQPFFFCSALAWRGVAWLGLAWFSSGQLNSCMWKAFTFLAEFTSVRFSWTLFRSSPCSNDAGATKRWPTQSPHNLSLPWANS